MGIYVLRGRTCRLGLGGREARLARRVEVEERGWRVGVGVVGAGCLTAGVVVAAGEENDGLWPHSPFEEEGLLVEVHIAGPSFAWREAEAQPHAHAVTVLAGKLLVQFINIPDVNYLSHLPQELGTVLR